MVFECSGQANQIHLTEPGSWTDRADFLILVQGVKYKDSPGQRDQNAAWWSGKLSDLYKSRRIKILGRESAPSVLSHLDAS